MHIRIRRFAVVIYYLGFVSLKLRWGGFFKRYLEKIGLKGAVLNSLRGDEVCYSSISSYSKEKYDEIETFSKLSCEAIVF